MTTENVRECSKLDACTPSDLLWKVARIARGRLSLTLRPSTTAKDQKISDAPGGCDD